MKTIHALRVAPGASIRFVRAPRPDMLRAYQLTYAQSFANGASILSSVQQFGRDATVKFHRVSRSHDPLHPEIREDASRMVPSATLPPPATTITTPSMRGARTVATRWVTDPGANPITRRIR